eukprot:scaffold3474_cov246-Pinguiococcus_pyrenoidosus.AAC.1
MRGGKRGTRFKKGASDGDLRISKVGTVSEALSERCKRSLNSSKATLPEPSWASRISIKSEAPGLSKTSSPGSNDLIATLSISSLPVRMTW